MTAKPPIRPVLEHYGWDGRVSGYRAWRNTRCPFHGDRTASGRVNEDEQGFHCNACDVSGDAYAIVMKMEGLDFAAAKRFIQEQLGFAGEPVPGGYESGRSLLPARSGDRRRRDSAVPGRGSQRRFRAR